MRANNLVDKAGRCHTDDDAENLLEEFKSAFLSTPQFCGFSTWNEEAYMEGCKPHLRFEMNYVISNIYILEVEPVIRDSELTISIALQLMKDGLGIESRSWETKDEEVIEVDANSDITVEDLAKSAREIALGFHTKIVENAGLGFTHDAARKAVERVWPEKP
ncbi:hypothetical protein [Acidithiobacillus thiooxidans]|uniref:Uncharacterized protein n=1 Tax=Acidithiobacillus thiooxidans TaxID=930 RepID=A0A1C2IUX9_ACITH|nr:hypothetical protein [Acidithiobacillus thiooxidans]OCX69488.1 hypothetical protein A6M23_15275 [Acidithiobacillus thiooxidans]OCX79757.1 hypothetical protein A6P08_17515 [Acidithiobacillus thiooxidans]